MIKDDDVESDQDAVEEIRHAANTLLKKARAHGRFPTPISDIIAAANLEIRHSFFSDEEILKIMGDTPTDKIKSARDALHGLVDIRGRIIYVRQDIPIGVEPPHLTVHEAAHAYLEWQRQMYLFVQENSYTLSKNTIDTFERQANQFAWDIIFQLDQFRTDAEKAEFSLRTPERLAHRYGTTRYAAVRRFVETNRRPCGLLIWSHSGAGGELAWPPCNRIQSKSFSHWFGDSSLITSLNRFSRNELISQGEFGHRMQIELTALNRQSIQCETTSMQMNNHLFVLICPSSEVSSIVIR